MGREARRHRDEAAPPRVGLHVADRLGKVVGTQGARGDKHVHRRQVLPVVSPRNLFHREVLAHPRPVGKLPQAFEHGRRIIARHHPVAAHGKRKGQVSPAALHVEHGLAVPYVGTIEKLAGVAARPRRDLEPTGTVAYKVKVLLGQGAEHPVGAPFLRPVDTAFNLNGPVVSTHARHVVHPDPLSICCSQPRNPKKPCRLGIPNLFSLNQVHKKAPPTDSDLPAGGALKTRAP